MRSAVKIQWEAGEWRPWFAWRPVRIKAGRMSRWVWLETVDRSYKVRGNWDPSYTYFYRLRDKQ